MPRPLATFPTGAFYLPCCICRRMYRAVIGKKSSRSTERAWHRIMKQGLFLSTANNRGLVLDPRTSACHVLVVSTIMLGSYNVGPLLVVAAAFSYCNTPSCWPSSHHFPAQQSHTTLYGCKRCGSNRGIMPHWSCSLPRSASRES